MQLTPENVKTLMSQGKTASEIGALIGVSKQSILRYVVSRKLGPWPYLTRERPVPDDFSSKIVGMYAKEALEYWRCSTKTLARWMKETGLRHLSERRAKFTHEELQKAYNGSIKDMAKTLGIDRGAASRYLRAAGIVRDIPPVPKATKPAKKHIGTHSDNFAMKNNIYAKPQRDMSPVGQAVEFLRTLGPVSRCDESGKIIETGKFWRRGGTYPLTNEDVIERASRLGWTLVTV